MTPKNIPIFYASLVVGLAGLWVFMFSIYDVTVAPLDPDYCCGAPIGAAFGFMLAKFMGAASLALFILSFLLSPRSSKKNKK